MCGGGEGLAELSTVGACALPGAGGSALLPWLIRLGVGPWDRAPQQAGQNQHHGRESKESEIAVRSCRRTARECKPWLMTSG